MKRINPATTSIDIDSAIEGCCYSCKYFEPEAFHFVNADKVYWQSFKCKNINQCLTAIEIYKKKEYEDAKE